MYRQLYKTMRKYNKANCTGCIRAQITDKWGRTITLTGIHAFDWTIYIEGKTGDMTIEHFTKGSIARKRFRELNKKRLIMFAAWFLLAVVVLITSAWNSD